MITGGSWLEEVFYYTQPIQVCFHFDIEEGEKHITSALKPFHIVRVIYEDLCVNRSLMETDTIAIDN